MDYKILGNKRGNDPGVYESVIFIVLNIIFFLAMLAFIYRSSSGAVVYEQTYAKQIALLLDQAKENSTIIIDMSDGVKIAQTNNKNGTIVNVYTDKNEVSVSLTDSAGYKYNYFSDYNISYAINKNYLVISVNSWGDENDK